MCSSFLNAQENATKATCASDPISCVEILELIADLQQSVTSCCANLNTCLQETNSLLNTIETPTTCDISVVIRQTDMPLTITASGHYCLSEPVVGSITIDADNVLINLNGYKISGGLSDNIVAVGHSGISICNGICGNAASSGNGVYLQTCTTVAIFNVNFQESETACRFDNVQNLLLQDCSFVEHVGDTEGVLIFENNTQDGKIASCQLYNSTRTDVTNYDTIYVDGCSNLSFINVYIQNSYAPNGSSFAGMFGLRNQTSNCLFDKCCALNAIGTNYNGFYLNNVSSTSCFNCIAQEIASNGFSTDNNCDDIVVQNCLVSNAQNNGINFLGALYCYAENTIVKNCSTGFNFSSSNNYIANNTAMSCTGRGFNITGGTFGVFFVGNYAENNGINYANFPATYSITTFETSGAGAGTFTRNAGGGLATPTDWDNISIVHN